MQNTDPIWDIVDSRRAAYTGLADRVFDMPEIAYDEYRSVEEHRQQLEAEGFKVTMGIAGIPTAVMGEAGEKGPVIAILGEFDALPGLSQEAGATSHTPLPGDGMGHGCGHNLLGSAALMAAASVKEWLEAEGIEARVRYYGCPAEEGGAAKTYMVRAGLFDDVDAAITWHPSPFIGVDRPTSLANTRIDFTFTGKAAHAAASPHLGRSALDAVELMNVGINYMREHMPDGCRVHYAYLDAGGIAPNVVPAKATVRQLVRAPQLPEMFDLLDRVRKIADGAALMTGTTVEAKVFSGVSNLLGNRPLEELLQANLDRLGAPDFDAEDRAFAEEIRATLSAEDIASTLNGVGLPTDPDLALCDFVVPLDTPAGRGGAGSTDVGDVSWAVPTAQCWMATCAMGTAFHSWQLTAQGKSPMAHKGMVQAAKAMAATARDLIREPQLLAAAKAVHEQKLAQTPYRCPLPDDVMPPVKG
ncbi:M20 family metallopeptidase [Pseudooceanicola nanhaiensis]|uniref:M20 family metallopeptidase n=1 Tax=Pseudooceanicola nanhaiensis TaxID=375761 RepID=UPI001CD7A038|nr:M20 family metallopeptidase [Pseudooceanicola nanhaiensis]MCA0922885.1 M20 family metallopeptidase [Pseudooceanicola nanhaiensis]